MLTIQQIAAQIAATLEASGSVTLTDDGRDQVATWAHGPTRKAILQTRDGQAAAALLLRRLRRCGDTILKHAIRRRLDRAGVMALEDDLFSGTFLCGGGTEDPPTDPQRAAA